MNHTLILTAQKHINDLLSTVFHHSPEHHAIIIYDTRCLLSSILSQAYKCCLKDAVFIDFDKTIPEEIHEKLNTLKAYDFVALVQSTSFRLDAFRLRIELFKRKIKVIEHPHLSRMADDEAPYYIDSLAYDSDYYRYVGPTLKSKIDIANIGILDSGDNDLLIYDTPFESAKLNIGDYTNMANIGGQFPLGEVFTEAQNLRALNGRVKIFCFGDVTYKINYPKVPITLIIEQGQVINCENSTPDFDLILSNIRNDECGVVWVRELGFGLNKAFSKTRTVADTGTYERMCGVHLSLGAKHGIYGKPGFKRRDGRYHVDVFAATHSFKLDDDIVYTNGNWTV
jgi:hypothetical protein